MTETYADLTEKNPAYLTAEIPLAGVKRRQFYGLNRNYQDALAYWGGLGGIIGFLSIVAFQGIIHAPTAIMVAISLLTSLVGGVIAHFAATHFYKSSIAKSLLTRKAIAKQVSQSFQDAGWKVDAEAVVTFQHRVIAMQISTGVEYLIGNYSMQKDGMQAVSFVLSDENILETQRQVLRAEQDSFYLNQAKSTVDFASLTSEEAYAMGLHKNRN